MTKSPLTRVLVLDNTPVLRADYANMLCRQQGPRDEGAKDGGPDVEDLEDDGFAGLFQCLAPPPAFPRIDLLLADDAPAALAAVKAGQAELRPFAVAFVEVRAAHLESDLQLLEALRAADPALQLVMVAADPSPHPLEVAERVPPIEQMFYLQKPFHPFEIHNLVLALSARWQGERTSEALDDSTAARGRASVQGGFDALPCGLILFDRRDHLVSANAKLRALLPELEELLVPGLPYDVLQKEIAARLLPDDTLFFEDSWVKERLEWHAKSGGAIDLRLGGGRWLVLAEAGGPLGETYCLYLDITGLKRRDQNRAAGQRLRHVAEALEAFCGALSAAADDSGCLPVQDLGPQLFHPGLQAGEPVKDTRGEADNAVLSELGRKLRIVTQAMPLLAEPLHLDSLVDELIQARQADLPETLDVEVVVGAGLWAVDADKALLRTTLAVLFDNALLATGQRGRIDIETENQRLDRDFVASRPALTQGDYVHLSVTDDGEGMTAEQADRAFIPFCSGTSDRDPTTTPGQLGLGLSMALGAVSQLGGHLEIESQSDQGQSNQGQPSQGQPDQGTTLHLYLPRAKAAVMRARKKGRAGKPAQDKDAQTLAAVTDQGTVGQDTVDQGADDDEGMIR